MPPKTRTTASDPRTGIGHDLLEVSTRHSFQFVDLTPRILELVARSGVTDGIVNVQTQHTTTAIVVNEHEPLLIEDLKNLLRRWAPRQASYRHDDLCIRTVNVNPGERPNGHSHARALMLGSSETLNLAGGAVRLGRWQRVFLVELDGPRERRVSVTVLGIVDRGRPTGKRLEATRQSAVA
jgi:secondary thiamine-phosphate synthase enzyme